MTIEQFRELPDVTKKAITKEFREEIKTKHLRCNNACKTWNREDHDCEIYGSQHPPFSGCYRAFIRWLEKYGGKDNE